MAKWGEGDPRWIVEERPDAVNVNNWHWTEKNASSWSKDRLTELLKNINLMDNEIGCIEFNEISSIEGEAIANNRKAKLIFFYEWVIKGTWVGKLNNCKELIKGEFEIPNLSEENKPEEVVVNFNYTENENFDKNGFLRDFLRIRGTQIVQNKISIYIKELREEYAKNLILPTKDALLKPEVIKSKTTINNSILNTQKYNSSSINKDLTEMQSINLTENLKCSPSDFYNALTNQEIFSMFTQEKVFLQPEVGGKFSFFGGNVEGKFIELIPNQLIKQCWRFKNWVDGHYSIVTIEIQNNNDSITVILKQEGVPSFDLERTKTGWSKYYFNAMKRILGFDSTLY